VPQFAYQGRNARGELVRGVMEGADSGAVADQLFNIGITPVNIGEAPAAGAGTGGLLRSVLDMRFGEPKVELADLMLFARQMHTLLKAGVPRCARASSRDASCRSRCGAIRRCFRASW
jgi:MSHA biogenesis protein MshG